MNIRKATQFQRINLATTALRILADSHALKAAPTTRIVILGLIDIMVAPPNVRESAYEALRQKAPTLMDAAEADSL